MSMPEKIGRYEIIRELGRGGMAVVYLARDPLMARRVAVKLLPRQFTFNESLRTRFQREARIVASLEHPAIVPVHDFGEFNEQPFLVMRYMVGGSLSQYAQDKSLPLPKVVQILTPLAQALDKAHTQHIIHRDLKPDNILFDGDNNPYLSDFGIARLAEGTQTTSIMGTPAYMSPEQITGDVELDGRSDIYAKGVILFEMLSGQQPYTGETPTNIMMKHVMEPVPSILALSTELPPATQGIIDKAMAKNREERFETAEEMVTAVHSLLSGTQAAEVGVAIAGTRVQETQLEFSDPAQAYQETVVESPADTQLEALYTSLQMANSQGDWVEVLAIGASIQRLDSDYRDVPAIVNHAKAQLTQPVSPSLSESEPQISGDIQTDFEKPPAYVKTKDVAESKRPIWLIIGGIVVVIILLCIVGWAAINLIGGEDGGGESSSSSAAGSSNLSASAGIEIEESPTSTPLATAPPSPTAEPELEPTNTAELLATDPPPTEIVIEVPLVEELFFDDFESKSSASNWELWQNESAEFEIADGRLTAVSRDEEMLSWARQQDTFSDFEAYVTAYILEGAREAFFGMVLAGEDETYFGCFIQGDNSAYCGESRPDAGQTEFSDWVVVDLSSFGGNEIFFVVSQEQWAMIVNDSCVGSGSSDYLREGQLGLVVSTSDAETPARVAYDDFLVQTPSEEGLEILGCVPDFYE